MKLLITGGAGYIGSHTVAALRKQGHEIVVFDNLSTGHAEALPSSVVLVRGDVRDEQALGKVFAQHRFDALLHFASKLDVAESVAQPELYQDNNVNGFATLLKVIERSSIRSIIFSSTAAVYGNAQSGQLVIENGPTLPMNPYGQTKLTCEQILKAHCQKTGVAGVALRYFNVAGAAVDGSNGQRSKAGTTLVKVAAEVAAGRRASMQINGIDYPTKDGSCVRDFIHVEDLADLHLAALNWSLQNPKFEIFNCGYGHGFSVREVITAMKKVSGVDFAVKEGPRREGDPTEVIANVSKMKQAFGWKAKHDDLETICRSAYQWEKS